MPTDMPAHDTSREEMWRAMLTSRNPYLRKRRIYGRIPSAPRCKLCAAPFGLPGSLVMSRLGHPRWVKNPKYCAGCFSMIRANHGGAEVECSLLFADIRGSVTLAEQMRPTDFNRLMGRFYDTATQVLVAQALLRKTGHDDRRGPWVPVGAGVNTGIAYVGSVGEEFDAELTALGDTVNTTAHGRGARRDPGHCCRSCERRTDRGRARAPVPHPQGQERADRCAHPEGRAGLRLASFTRAPPERGGGSTLVRPSPRRPAGRPASA